MIPAVSMEVWGCAAVSLVILLTILLKIKGTLILHGYHSILHSLLVCAQ